MGITTRRRATRTREEETSEKDERELSSEKIENASRSGFGSSLDSFYCFGGGGREELVGGGDEGGEGDHGEEGRSLGGKRKVSSSKSKKGTLLLGVAWVTEQQRVGEERRRERERERERRKIFLSAQSCEYLSTRTEEEN